MQSTSSAETVAEDTVDKNSLMEIAEIAPMEKTVQNQVIEAYSGVKPLLPENVSVRLSDSVSFEPVAVTWTDLKSYNNKSAGTYNYQAAIVDNYCLAPGVKLPAITVKVIKCKVEIKGAAKNLTKKARYLLSDKVVVHNGYGSKLLLQMYNKKTGKWVTKKTITLKNIAKQELTVNYPKDWWKVTESKWRMRIKPTAGKTGIITEKTVVKTKRFYQNPPRYVQIQDSIKIDNAGTYTLKSGYMGLKVRAVNRYFGIGSKYWPRYTSTTKAKVRAFQKRHGLKVTGNVNKATWLKMGYSEYSWKNKGAYVSPIRVNPSSTKKDHIEAMISRAYDYMGSDFVVGASGKPSQGADCSGIVMQALYAAGVEIKGINPVTHSWAGHEYESRNMWEHANFKKIPYSEKKRGDLIFYKGSSGRVNHVSIYLGKGKVIESWPNKVRVAKVGHHRIMGAMRVFN